jgi:hypothetical protein
MKAEVRPDETEMKIRRLEIGCTGALFAINALLIGLFALVFGTYRGFSSFEQELWYRYGSLGFLFAGVGIPFLALALGARRSGAGLMWVSIWMVLVLAGFLFYAAFSSGGV